MIVSSKKKGSAVVEFATVRSAVSIPTYPESVSSFCLFSHENLLTNTHLHRTTFVYHSTWSKRLRAPTELVYD